MEKQKQRKVMEITVEGIWFKCIVKYGTRNPYRLYVCHWENGERRKQVAAYGNFISVIECIRQYAHKAHWGFEEAE